MKQRDLGWSAIYWHNRLRRTEEKRAAGLSKQMLRGAVSVSRHASAAFLRFSGSEARNPWFTTDEATATNLERTELLTALAGPASFSARGSKIHLGPLAPGCAICMDGSWGCNYVNGRCQKSCFYCLSDHSMPVEPDPHTDDFSFTGPAEHITFLKTFHIKGVGFSGGEPLLAFERLLDHITAIRGEFGSDFHLWMYTNGVLVDHSTLKRLREAGLDEIRFDLSAREYDLSPVIIAPEHIPTVTVEIPAIPEDETLMRDLLRDLEALGVNHLNLHQLIASQRNWRALYRRGYHFSSQLQPAVYESELCALRLLLHAHEQGIQLPINYCSYAYRDRFYSRALRKRRGLAAMEEWQQITDSGYVRSLSVIDSADAIEHLTRRFERDHVDPRLWKRYADPQVISIHISLTPHIDWSSALLTIAYQEAVVSLKDPSGPFEESNLEVRCDPVMATTGVREGLFDHWRRMYRVDVGSKTAENTEEHAIAALNDYEMNQLQRMDPYEVTESGLPEAS